MALTADEQALLDSLTKKAAEKPAGPDYDTFEKIVRYLVQTSAAFTANPEDRQVMLDVLDGFINPQAAEPNAGN